MLEHILWTEKFRPHRVADCVLPPRMKAVFQGFVDEGAVTNLLLVGPSGCGKTTVAKAMLDELAADYVVINASLEGNIDTLRTDISTYCSSVSLTGGRRYVVLDEADYLTAATQPALRAFMEDFADNCSFILTANYRDRIIPALQSRCAVIDFGAVKSEGRRLAAQFMKRVSTILAEEEVRYEPAAVAEVIVRYFPDFRRVLNELQAYSKDSGVIDTGVLAGARTSVDQFVGRMRDKDFTGCRRWIGENADVPPERVFRELYERAADLAAPQSVPVLVLALAKYQDMASRVADQEINLAAMAVELMIDITWKT